ncbi:MAG: hypothetical protein KF773_12380 [Deltaproteobacteria bacterium]|nr:hypothetical protein [Deltaproteobacteria bacterium]
MRVVGVLVSIGLVACGADEITNDGKNGTLAGQVVVSGPLRGAKVSVEQLRTDTGEVQDRVNDAETNGEGRFTLETGVHNGLFRIVARGGSYTDLATGTIVQLDATDELHAVVPFEILEIGEDFLVSPISHLIAARFAAVTLPEASGPKGALDALAAAAAPINQHFGQVRDWTRLSLVGLDQPATSPTEPVRAALVQAALSFLVQDTAIQSGASPQDVHVLTLARAWAEDLSDGPFDGNDKNDIAYLSGIQLGTCPPLPPGCVAPSTGCAIGACRTLCDLYANHPRSLLAGVMKKVIGNKDVNKTGLNDIVAVASAVNDNLSVELFADVCRESLDRVPPTIVFDGETPAENAFVRGTRTVHITVSDDNPNPRASFEGLVDTDGDPTNEVAQATIDTTAVTDGTFAVIAKAVDMAGNTATLTRTFQVDNAPPVVTLDATGFFVDIAANTWWTDKVTPILRGTVDDVAPKTIVATIGAVTRSATITGNSWQVTFSAGDIDLAGGNVLVTATDEAGNQTTAVQRIRADLTPPEINVLASAVLSELNETITFSPGAANVAEVPTHRHAGAPINLATGMGASCPTVHKHAYLLGAAAPAYGIEEDTNGNPQRNPLHLTFVSGDTGVGITPGSTKFRVGRRDASNVTVWLTQLLSAGTPTPVGAGFDQYDVRVVSDQVAGLATTEGVYDVELTNQDRLGRTTTTARCFTLKLLAAPLDFQPPAAIGMPAAGPATGHKFALNSLSLAPAAPFDEIAARLLNADAGASLLDQPIVNGTAETVFLTVTVTLTPTMVQAARTFVMHNARTSVSDVSLKCEGAGGDPNNCNSPTGFTPFTSSNNVLGTVNNPTYLVKVFELDAANQPTTEVPCIAPCPGTSPSGPTFRFAIPPRAAPGQTGAPFRKFVAMTMLGPVTNLHPSVGASPAQTFAAPPFVDTTLAGVRITGKLETASTGCTKREFPAGVETCKERSTIRPYRALTRAQLQFTGSTDSSYATAAASTIAPIERAMQTRSEGGWITNEGTLPTYTIP